MVRLLTLTFCALLLHFSSLYAQLLTDWARRYSVSDPIFSFGKNLNITAMEADESGNVYLAGFHRGALLNGQDTVSAPYDGAQTGFLQKKAPNGDIIWYRRLTMADLRDLKLSGGAIYLAGEVASAEYGPLKVQTDGAGATTTLFAQGHRDGFIARYDLDGNLDWAKVYGGADSEDLAKGDHLNSIEVDQNGYIYITGSYHRQMGFNTEGATFSEPSDRGKTFYLAKLDPEGGLVWARDIDSPVPIDGGNAEGTHLALTPEGAPVVALAYSAGGLLIDGEVLLNDNLDGDRGCLLLKYDMEGERLWYRNIEPQEGLIAPFGLEADASGQIVLGFAHEQQVLIDESEPLNYFEPEDDLLKSALLAWDASGALRWANTLFCSNAAMDVRPDGTIYIAAAAFRPAVALSPEVTLDFAPGGSVSLWARFSSGGSLAWAHQPTLLGEPPFSTNHNVMAGPAGKVYASANFNRPLGFGNGWELTNGYSSPDFDALYWVQFDDSAVSSAPGLATPPLQVFPNPTRGDIQVRLPAAGTLELWNMAGHLVWSAERKKGLQLMALPTLPAGAYCLQARLPGRLFRQLLVIQQ